MTTFQDELDNDLRTKIKGYWLVLLNWKWTALSIFLLIFIGATLFALLKTPTFTSRASIWIESEPNILPFEEVGQFGSTSPWELPSYFQLLQSRALMTNTIDKLKLYENPRFVDDLHDGPAPADMTDPVLMEKLIDLFLKKITINRLSNTKLVEVQLSDSDPLFASQALDTLIDAFVQMTIRMRFAPTQQASDFLATQISKVRKEISEKQTELQEYGEDKNIVTLSTQETSYIQNLSKINEALTTAQIERIDKETYYNAIKNATLGDIPAGMTNPLIQNLRQEYFRLNREYASLVDDLKPEFPEMQRKKAELDKAREDLLTETENLKRSAYSEYQAARQREESLQERFEKQRTESYGLNSNYLVYTSLKNEIDNKKSLLEELIRRQSEMNLSADLEDIGSSNLWIVDRASVPVDPSFPKKRQVLLIGLLAGLMAGIGSSLALDYLNSTVRTSKDVRKLTGLATLGVIPSLNSGSPKTGIRKEIQNIRGIVRKQTLHQKKLSAGDKTAKPGRPVHETIAPKGQNGKSVAVPDRIELITHHHPDSIQAENFRSIRTTLSVSSPPGKIKTIMFTSPLAQDGKSSTISNLGLTLAQANKRVVIVDSDLRKPRQATIFQLNKENGLTTFLSSHVDWLDLVRPTGFQNLYVINSGPVSPNPIELLSSEKMDDLVAFLKRSFDYILFDTPPILVVSDAIALGPLIDAVILIARGGQTPTQALLQAKQKLDTHRLKCLGVILNDVGLFSTDGYDAYHYYQYYKT